MIYLGESTFDDEYPPMSGTRVGHEVVSEGLIDVRVEYADQSFRSARRTLSMVGHMFEIEPEPDDECWEEAMNYLHRTAGRRPLT